MLNLFTTKKISLKTASKQELIEALEAKLKKDERAERLTLATVRIFKGVLDVAYADVEHGKQLYTHQILPLLSTRKIFTHAMEHIAGVELKKFLTHFNLIEEREVVQNGETVKRTQMKEGMTREEFFLLTDAYGLIRHFIENEVTNK